LFKEEHSNSLQNVKSFLSVNRDTIGETMGLRSVCDKAYADYG